MSTLKKLSITSNTSEGVQAITNHVMFEVTTTSSSTVTIERSIDGVTFKEIPDLSWTINGTDFINAEGIKEGQFLRVKSSATMTKCIALV